MAFLRMTDVELAGKRVLVRQDLNVPVKDGRVTGDARIRAGLPTLRHALDAGARVMVMSHLGRPTEGRFEDAYSMAPVAARLGELLGDDRPAGARPDDHHLALGAKVAAVVGELGDPDVGVGRVGQHHGEVHATAPMAPATTALMGSRSARSR